MISAIDRFEAKIGPPNPESPGCIEWVGAIQSHGYGNFWDGKSYQRAHRFAYEYFVGKIPDGLQIDHLCRNRKCVNTDHLEPVTCRENLLRGNSTSAIHAKKTHCPKGHEYSPENSYCRPNRNERQCRQCRRKPCQ